MASTAEPELGTAQPQLVLLFIPSITIDQMSTLRRKKQLLKTKIFRNKKTSLEHVIQS